MSVEPLIISALVEEGTPKLAFQAGITVEDFELYDEEFQWLCGQYEKRRPITPRRFKQKFPEFDFVLPRENVRDLFEELKQERAFVAISAGIDQVLEDLDHENVIEKAIQLREVLGDALRIHAPNQDVRLRTETEGYLQRLKNLQALMENGEIPGIPTGLKHFDAHFGGWQGECSYVFLGRPGDAKSFLLAKAAVEAEWAGYRVGFFSPEMTLHQHQARFNTLRSAREEVQRACNLKGAFRNRALKDGHGFNLKTFARFLAWYEANVEGEIYLFTQKYRMQKMSIGYIESRIEDYGLDMIIVDPLYKLRSPKLRKSRWEELGEITDALTDIAHSHNIPVLMSNQANRALVGKRGIAPDKDSSFGTDAPVQEGDTVVGVKHYSEERLMKLKCSKNRHGEDFTFSVNFVPNIGVMQDDAPRSYSENGEFQGTLEKLIEETTSIEEAIEKVEVPE